jgi:diguanylate cyclase (GGDEF)-like protein
MTIAVIALAAALAALAVVATLALVGRQARAQTDDRIAAALDQMGMRMDGLVRDLNGTLTRVQADGAHARALGELGGSLDLDEVLARTADAAAALAGADAAVVRAVSQDGKPLVAARGVPVDEAAEQVLAGPPDGSLARAVGVSFVYRPGSEPPGALRSGYAVPLLIGGETNGFVAVYSHDPGASPGEEEVSQLEALAEAAGPAIENAARFKEARHLAEVDALTGLQNRRTFHETLAREVGRAHRYDRRLAVLVIDLDNFKAVNESIGHLAGDHVLSEVAQRIRESVRGADIACRIGGDEFAVILPESARIDAEGLFARVQATLRGAPPTQAPKLTVSGGIAELTVDDDAVSLFERADDALYRAKDAGKGTAA